MGLELQLLVWAAALTVVQALIFVVGGVLQVGLPPWSATAKVSAS